MCHMYIMVQKTINFSNIKYLVNSVMLAGMVHHVYSNKKMNIVVYITIYKNSGKEY